MFKRKIPSRRQENINYGEYKEGRETGMWQGRALKGRFHFEFRPEPLQERSELSGPVKDRSFRDRGKDGAQQCGKRTG